VLNASSTRLVRKFEITWKNQSNLAKIVFGFKEGNDELMTIDEKIKRSKKPKDIDDQDAPSEGQKIETSNSGSMIGKAPSCKDMVDAKNGNVFTGNNITVVQHHIGFMATGDRCIP
jgi:hypothetical protein